MYREVDRIYLLFIYKHVLPTAWMWCMYLCINLLRDYTRFGIFIAIESKKEPPCWLFFTELLLTPAEMSFKRKYQKTIKKYKHNTF